MTSDQTPPEHGDDDEDRVLEAERAAMRVLAPRDHASGELRRKLESRDFGASTIDTVIERLEEMGYLDDEQFARRQSKLLADKHWGPRRIRQKLYKRDLPDYVIDHALQEIGVDLSWARQCRQHLDSRFAAPDELDRSEKEKAFRHLRHRGYRSSTIRSVLFDSDGA